MSEFLKQKFNFYLKKKAWWNLAENGICSVRKVLAMNIGFKEYMNNDFSPDILTNMQRG